MEPRSSVAFLPYSATIQRIQIDSISLKSIGSFRNLFHFHTQHTNQIDQFVHIPDIGNIADRHLFGS